LSPYKKHLRRHGKPEVRRMLCRIGQLNYASGIRVAKLRHPNKGAPTRGLRPSSLGAGLKCSQETGSTATLESARLRRPRSPAHASLRSIRLSRKSNQSHTTTITRGFSGAWLPSKQLAYTPRDKGRAQTHNLRHMSVYG